LSFPSGTRIHSSSPFSCYMPCSPHSHFIILIILCEEYKLRSSSFRSFLQPLITTSLFNPNVLFITLLSNILSLCASLNVKHQVLAHTKHYFCTV
jgi:hypothetical protein